MSSKGVDRSPPWLEPESARCPEFSPRGILAEKLRASALILR